MPSTPRWRFREMPAAAAGDIPGPKMQSVGIFQYKIFSQQDVFQHKIFRQ
jgi:hypothetical protein